MWLHTLLIMDANTAFARVDRAYETCKGAELEQALLGIASQCATENGNTSPLYAAMCSELGGYYRGQARYADSELAFRKAIDILRLSVGETSPDYTTALNNLAGTYRAMGNFAEAEQLFQRCLENYQKTIGTHHVLYASGLNNYALVCLDRGDLDRAAELLGQSSDILSELPQCIDEYASALCNRSALLLRLGRGLEAIPLLKKAIALFENELGTDTPHYHAALHTLGLSNLQQGNFSMAVDNFTSAVRAAETLYGPNHPETEAARHSLAFACKKLEESK